MQDAQHIQWSKIGLNGAFCRKPLRISINQDVGRRLCRRCWERSGSEEFSLKLAKMCAKRIFRQRNLFAAKSWVFLFNTSLWLRRDVGGAAVCELEDGCGLVRIMISVFWTSGGSINESLKKGYGSLHNVGSLGNTMGSQIRIAGYSARVSQQDVLEREISLSGLGCSNRNPWDKVFEVRMVRSLLWLECALLIRLWRNKNVLVVFSNTMAS